MIVTKEIEIGGKKLSLETGRFAKQANGAVMVRYGDTMVLVTAVAAEDAKEDQDFFPLQVETEKEFLLPVNFPADILKGKEDLLRRKY